MLTLLSQLRHKCAIGFVGGSDLVKQQEQLGTSSTQVTSLFDFCFAENGLTAYRLGKQLVSSSFIQFIGEDKYKELVNWCLIYIAKLDIPVKRGTFVEFRCVWGCPTFTPLFCTTFSGYNTSQATNVPRQKRHDQCLPDWSQRFHRRARCL